MKVLLSNLSMMTLKKLDNNLTISWSRLGRKQFAKEGNDAREAQFLSEARRYDNIKLQLITRLFPSRHIQLPPFRSDSLPWPAYLPLTTQHHLPSLRQAVHFGSYAPWLIIFTLLRKLLFPPLSSWRIPVHLPIDSVLHLRIVV